MAGDLQLGASNTGAATAGRAAPGPAAALNARQLVEALQALRRMPLSDDYWLRYCDLVAPLARARAAMVVAQREATADWQVLAVSAQDSAGLADDWQAPLADLAERALDNGFSYAPVSGAHGSRLLAVLRIGQRQDAILLLLDIPEQERGRLNELLLRVQLVADLPVADTNAVFQGAAIQGAAVALPAAAAEPCEDAAAPAGEALAVPDRPTPPTAVDVGPAETSAPAGEGIPPELLDLCTLVMREKRYGAAAMALVNGLAARSGCALVALGWRKDGHVTIEAISHVDRFERKAEYVGLIEAACEEAADQGSDIAYSRNDADTGLIVQAHARLKRSLGYGHICTVPWTGAGDAPTAVVLMAYESPELAPRATGDVHLVLGLTLPWLSRLRDSDRWWGHRLADSARSSLQGLLGPERPLLKFFGILVALLLVYALVGTKVYRIEATAQLSTDSTRLIGASYDGFLARVEASSGETVKEGALLAALDTRELIQQEIETQADIERLRAESVKARAAFSLADAEIAGLRQAQAEARLMRIRFSLGQSNILAPFDGVVVEGERKDLLGGAVKKGDRLFRVARIEGLYAVLQVPEREIRYLEQNAKGELTLLARPETRIPFEVETVIPAAQIKGQDGNHFVINVKLLQAQEPWWRPGMSGMARIEAGERNVAWIYTHKAIDSLRMMFWL